MNGVHADVLRAIADGHRFGENPHRPFGCVVGGMAAQHPHQAGNGRNVDNRTAPVAAHLLNGVLRPQKNARSVNVHNPGPGVQAVVIRDGAAADAGVVHQNVQPPETGNGFTDDIGPGVLAGHIRMNIPAGAAGLVDFRFHPASVIVANVGNDHFRPLAGKQAGFHGAHPVSAAADDGNLVLQSHSSSVSPGGAGAPAGGHRRQVADSITAEPGASNLWALAPPAFRPGAGRRRNPCVKVSAAKALRPGLILSRSVPRSTASRRRLRFPGWTRSSPDARRHKPGFPLAPARTGPAGPPQCC